MPEIPNYVEYMRRADALLPGQICKGHEGSLRVVNLGVQLARADGHLDVGLLEEPGSEIVLGCKADVMLLDLGDGTAQVIDVVANDGGNQAYITWQIKDTRSMDRWRLPFDWPIPGEPAMPVPDPPTLPDVPQPVSDLAPVLVALEGITARLDTLIAAINAQRAEQVAGLAQVAAAAKEGIKLKFGF